MPSSRVLGLCFALAALVFTDHPADAFDPEEVVYCADGGVPERPCAALPADIADFDSSFIYHFLSEGAQFPFDNFSWQSFVSLNWPMAGGVAVEGAIGDHPALPRRWQAFERVAELFAAGAGGVCADESAADSLGDVIEVSEFLQATGEPVIDRNLNYLVYDVRINRVAADYIRANGLASRAGQAAFGASDDAVDFPQSRQPNMAGSAVLKSSWKIVDPATGEAARYFTRPARIAVAADHNADGRARCHHATLGLVGLHIMRRTMNGNGDRWIWSTFEHADNAPFATNARDPNSILTHELFPDGCLAPANARGYALHDPDCPDCPSNAIEPADWTWAPDPPFARAFARGGAYGTQLVRCWKPFHGTEKLNKLWQAKLAGTVWAHYGLVSTQWKGNYGGGFFNVGEVPRFLANSVLETYVQADASGTCLGCHAEARTTAGRDANFSFLLDRAR